MRPLPKEEKAGLYITVIVHLVVLIALLVAQLGASIKKESSFVLDFSKVEELEKLQRELSLQQQVNEKLNRMLSEEGVNTSPVRNVTVDRGSLKDDRGTDAQQLYKDAERIQKELDQTFNRSTEEDIALPQTQENKKEDKSPEQKTSYKGPSVLSWTLEGRKASKLPIPAYRCMGAGEVKVLITVDNSGTVTGAKVDEASSSQDACLRSYAVRAARLSKFSADPKAPARQTGDIVYQFIAQ